MNTLTAYQLGEIPTQHLERGAMARPQCLHRPRVLDLLELAQQGRAKVHRIGVGGKYPTVRCKDHPGDGMAVQDSARAAAAACSQTSGAIDALSPALDQRFVACRFSRRGRCTIELWRIDYNAKRPTSLNGLAPFAFANRPPRTTITTDSGYDQGQRGGRVSHLVNLQRASSAGCKMRPT
jgi:hypothetical protein